MSKRVHDIDQKYTKFVKLSERKKQASYVCSKRHHNLLDIFMNKKNYENTKLRVIPSRLVHMRHIAGMTQKMLGESISEIIFTRDGRSMKFTCVSISQWETGSKPVPKKYVDIICDLLGCTKEYLYGQSNNPLSDVIEEEDETTVEVEPVKITNLHKYDNCPVYVFFNNYQHPNGWALLNFESDRLIMTSSVIKLSSLNLDDVTFYPMKPLFVPNVRPDGSKKLDLIRALKSEYVYIVMNSSDRTVRAMYDGLYHHNETHQGFINGEGLFLPYEGFNKAYSAYENIDDLYY